ncbi:MAG: hypothetical protein H7Y86_17705 [Rhizobacter sp.]|nr:hypothetical protein [Ferruginibacter sp.]
MKQFFYLTILFAFLSTAAIAQGEPVAANIKASVTDNNLMLTWNEVNTTEQGSWEVQASADGKQFSTIGLVWGADPKATNGYAFKQKTNKLQSNYKYFRVLYVADANTAVASNTIGLSK